MTNIWLISVRYAKYILPTSIPYSMYIMQGEAVLAFEIWVNDSHYF